jgi:Na+-transporting methylmalonyl-CoA/oxaloacetate decarboxylase gamma subunit
MNGSIRHWLASVDVTAPPVHFRLPGGFDIMGRSIWLILLDWVPILIFLGLLIYFMRKTAALNQKGHLEATRKYMEEHLAEVRRTNDALARIAAALERKSGG